MMWWMWSVWSEGFLLYPQFVAVEISALQQWTSRSGKTRCFKWGSKSEGWWIREMRCVSFLCLLMMSYGGWQSANIPYHLRPFKLNCGWELVLWLLRPIFYKSLYIAIYPTWYEFHSSIVSYYRFNVFNGTQRASQKKLLICNNTFLELHSKTVLEHSPEKATTKCNLKT